MFLQKRFVSVMRHFLTVFFLCICAFASGGRADDHGCVRNNCMGTCITREEALGKMIPMICRAEFACYQDAECVKKEDGSCGWTETQQLKDCIAQKKKDAKPSLSPPSPLPR